MEQKQTMWVRHAFGSPMTFFSQTAKGCQGVFLRLVLFVCMLVSAQAGRADTFLLNSDASTSTGATFYVGSSLTNYTYGSGTITTSSYKLISLQKNGLIQ